MRAYRTMGLKLNYLRCVSVSISFMYLFFKSFPTHAEPTDGSSFLYSFVATQTDYGADSNILRFRFLSFIGRFETETRKCVLNTSSR